MYPEAELPRRVLPIERVNAVLECILCSGFPTQIGLILVLSGFGLSMQGTEGGLNPRFVFTLSLLDTGLAGLPGARAFLGVPASHNRTCRQHRPSSRAALRPAGPPPTTTTSNIGPGSAR